jgi:hypothetical protein
LKASFRLVLSAHLTRGAASHAGCGDVAEGTFDDVAAEVAERVDDGYAGGAVDSGELVLLATKSAMVAVTLAWDRRRCRRTLR